MHRQWWHGLDHEAQLRHVVSSHVHMGIATEKEVRGVCVPMVVAGLVAVLDDLKTANASFCADVLDLAA